MKKIKIRRCKKSRLPGTFAGARFIFYRNEFFFPVEHSETGTFYVFCQFHQFVVTFFLSIFLMYPVYRHYPQQIDNIAAKIAVEPFAERIFPFQKQRIGKTVFKLTVYIEQNGMTVGKESRIIPRDVRESGKVGDELVAVEVENILFYPHCQLCPAEALQDID